MAMSPPQNLEQDSLVCLLCNFGGNLDGNLLNPFQVWVQPSHSKVLLRIDIASLILHVIITIITITTIT